MKQLKDVLELPLILDQIKDFSFSEIGKKSFNDFSFLPVDSLSNKLIEVDQMMQLVQRFGSLPIHQSFDLTTLLSLLSKGSVLHIDQFSAILLDLENVTKLKSFILQMKGDFPSCIAYIQQLPKLTSLHEKIKQIIGSDLNILDTASDQLYGIRKKLKSIDQKLLTLIQSAVSTYAKVLAEPMYTLRNGHYVLPVVSSLKGQVPGVIHDVSSTGLTSYIEPRAVLELSQQKQSLLVEEQDEVFKILTELSAFTLPFGDEISLINTLIATLDVIQAKAKYGILHQGHVATLSLSPIINIHGARHPLIDPKMVIANNFLLTEQQSIIIISGPNAGGKTVAMKTVGLFVYMNQLAIPLPTSKPATLSYFKHIYADIGDNQSVLENLSTFAGHIQNLVPLTDKVKPNDLVLIDELGTGTDPKEGESLARSLLIHLQAKKAFVIVSSHFPGLKTLAIEEPRMINASLQFDEEKLMPTYRFILGVPGKSYGLIMAKRYGLASQVVMHAEKYLAEQNQSQEQKHLLRLQAELDFVEQEKQKLEALQITLNHDKEHYHKLVQQTLVEKNNYQQKVKDLQSSMLEELEAKVDEVIKSLANPNLKLHQAIALKKSFQQEELETDVDGAEDVLSVGDYVVSMGTGIQGKITVINKKNITFVSSDGLTINTKVSKVEKIETPMAKKKQNVYLSGHVSKAPTSINIIGLRYEEAQSVVEKYYDQALLSGLKTLKIIHGFGTGTLKKMVNDYFKDLKTVKSIQLGEGEQSGYGVTVVHLK
jgi:DNA mismatch repair protein MutS2